MPNVAMVSNPKVADTYGRVAMQRGPLVYGLEQLDQGSSSLGDLFIRSSLPSTIENKRDLLGGIILLKVPGTSVEKTSVEEPLYMPLAAANSRARKPVTLTFIPFYALGNREPSPTEVWVPRNRMDSVTTPTSPTAGEKRTDGR